MLIAFLALLEMVNAGVGRIGRGSDSPISRSKACWDTCCPPSRG